MISCSLLADPNSEDDTVNRRRRIKFLNEISRELGKPQLIEPKPKTFSEFLDAFWRYLYAMTLGLLGGAVHGVSSHAQRFYESMNFFRNAGNENDIQMAFHFSECPICFSSEYNNVSSYACAPHECQHIFHENCLRHWCETHDTCPTCRTNIDIDAIHILNWNRTEFLNEERI